jgi:DNA repair protein RAD50
LRAQLQTLEGDLRDYKDINKKYTDQLVKVKVSFLATIAAKTSSLEKMSDMANNDLEKYGKALDK